MCVQCVDCANSHPFVCFLSIISAVPATENTQLLSITHITVKRPQLSIFFFLSHANDIEDREETLSLLFLENSDWDSFMTEVCGFIILTIYSSPAQVPFITEDPWRVSFIKQDAWVQRGTSGARIVFQIVGVNAEILWYKEWKQKDLVSLNQWMEIFFLLTRC